MASADVVFSWGVPYVDTAMNSLIVTIITALGVSVVGVLVASWLYRRAMNGRFDNLKTYLDSRFAEHERTYQAPTRRGL